MYIEYIHFVAVFWSQYTSTVNLFYDAFDVISQHSLPIPFPHSLNNPIDEMSFASQNGRLRPSPLSLPALLALMLSRSFMARW